MKFTRGEVLKITDLVIKEINELKKLSDNLKYHERLKDDPFLPRLIKEYEEIEKKLNVLYKEIYWMKKYQVLDPGIFFIWFKF